MAIKEEIIAILNRDADIAETENRLDYYIYNMDELAEKIVKLFAIPVVINWVAIDDKLPNCYEPVLVCFDKEWTSSERTGFWDGASWVTHGDKPILTDKVIYWATLPEPPCLQQPYKCNSKSKLI